MHNKWRVLYINTHRLQLAIKLVSCFPSTLYANKETLGCLADINCIIHFSLHKQYIRLIWNWMKRKTHNTYIFKNELNSFYESFALCYNKDFKILNLSHVEKWAPKQNFSLKSPNINFSFADIVSLLQVSVVCFSFQHLLSTYER